MHFSEDSTQADAPARPLNLGLNDGTWSSARSVEALARFNHNNALRNYTTAENKPLIQTIAEVDKVGPENVYLANGSGPLLKQCFPYLVKRSIMASPLRIMRHLLFGNGYPIITPAMTYCKVPKGAANHKLTVRPIPLSHENNFQLSVDDLRAELRRQDGIVYIVNPNNPTGNVLIQREPLIELMKAHPKSLFWIDEAYVQYVDPALHTPLSDLVPHHKNMVVSRSFSFAYGLASLRLGYLLCDTAMVKEFASQVPDYRVGGLQEAMGVASLTDPDHLPFVRKESATQRAIITEGLSKIPGIQTFPSQTNFILCRFTDNRSGEELAKRLAKRGLLIKHFDPVMGFTYTPFFRLTIGLHDENQLMLMLITETLKEYTA